jgi:hypothetical protein
MALALKSMAIFNQRWVNMHPVNDLADHIMPYVHHIADIQIEVDRADVVYELDEVQYYQLLQRLCYLYGNGKFN